MRHVAIGFAGALVLAQVARAAVVEMEMIGRIATVQDSLGLLPFAHVGDRVVYRFSYDSEAPDTNGTPTSAFYAGIHASLRAGTQDISVLDAPAIEIQHPNDLFDVSSNLANTGLSQNLTQGFVYFRLSDQPNGDALTSTDLPLIPYDLSLFLSRGFQVSFFGPPASPPGENPYLGLFAGTIDFFYLVPEPVSLLLFAFAIMLSFGPRILRSLRGFYVKVSWCAAGIGVLAVVYGPLTRPSTSEAAVLTFATEGTIQSIIDPAGLLPSVHPGDRVIHTFSFDSNTPDTYPLSSAGVYEGITASLRVGSIEIPSMSPLPRIEVIPPYGVMSRYRVTSFLSSGSLQGSTYSHLDDGIGDVISSDALPLVPLDLNLFSFKEFSVSLFGPLQPPDMYPPMVNLSGYIDSFYAVPEPTSMLLVIAALCACCSIRHGSEESARRFLSTFSGQW
jgi:hypothetical protein